MAKSNNLSDLLKSVADAIREKKGTSAKINPQNFDTEIEGIETGTDVSGVTAGQNDVKAGKKFVNNVGQLLDGTVPDRTSTPQIIVEPGNTPPFVPGGQYADNQTYIHLDPAAADIIKAGESLLGVDGTFTGIDTTDATAEPDDILSGKTAYSGGEKITGTIPTYNGETETDAAATQDKTINVTSNGQIIVEADEGKVLGKVIINVNVGN